MSDSEYDPGVFTQKNPSGNESDGKEVLSEGKEGSGHKKRKMLPAKIGISPDGIPFFIDGVGQGRVRKKRKKRKRKATGELLFCYCNK